MILPIIQKKSPLSKLLRGVKGEEDAEKKFSCVLCIKLQFNNQHSAL